MKNETKRYLLLFALSSLGITLMVHLSAYVEWFIYARRMNNLALNTGGFGSWLLRVSINGLATFLTFLIIHYIIKPFKESTKGNYKFYLTTILLAVVSMTVLTDSFFRIKNLIEGTPFPIRISMIYSMRDLMTVMGIVFVVFFVKNMYDRQAALHKSNELIIDNLKRQYESLKNQLSPHFFFNTITALKELIDESPEIARQYLYHLSRVLRYTLQSNENQTVKLKEEMEMVHSYLFLVRKRFNSSLNIVESIDHNYSCHKIPPLTVHTLVENAIKHNEISKRNHLTISIQTTDSSSLIVSNNLRKKQLLEPTTGIGLNNLSNQYRLLCGQEIAITALNGEFNVEVPLLRP